MTNDIESLKNILLDGALKTGDACPIKTIKDCMNAVYFTVIFDENQGYELMPGTIYLKFSPELLLNIPNNKYHFSNGIFYGKFQQNESYTPKDIEKFIKSERKRLTAAHGEKPNDNELVVFQDVPLNFLTEIWVTSPGPNFLASLIRKKQMTQTAALEELLMWSAVDAGLLSPDMIDVRSIQSEVVNMLKENGLDRYLDKLKFTNKIR